MLLSACGLKSLLPEGPAVGAAERTAFVSDPCAARYVSEPEVPFPVLPVMAWGVAYDLDIVLVSDHPTWNMHEYARLTTPDGQLWIAKDAREATMSQSIVADVDDLYEWLPELPVERRPTAVDVVDRSTDQELDLELRYVNLDGDPVEVTYRGKPPVTAQRKRNGSAMGHSRDQLIAVLDLPFRTFGRAATMRIGGEPVRIRRILGLVPFRMALVQTQGGLSSGTWDQEAADQGGFTTLHHMPDERQIRAAWTVTPTDDGAVEARQAAPLRDLVYRFAARDDGSLELTSARVEQFGRDVPVTEVTFAPALPDLRRRFEGRIQSRFVIDINGQPGHATGRVEVWWTEAGPHVDVLPEAPWWTTDRPLRAQWTHDQAGVHASVRVERTD